MGIHTDVDAHKKCKEVGREAHPFFPGRAAQWKY